MIDAHESLLEREAIRFAKHNGWEHRKLRWQGRRSAMDQLFLGHGRAIFVEFKSRNEKPTPLQKREIDRLRKRYPEIYVCNSMYQFMMILKTPGGCYP